MDKYRGIFEGSEWDACRQKIDPDLRRFDEAFRFAYYNIAVEPRINTTPFLSENHRILRVNFPGVAELWVYFRIEPDDNNCTLLWIHSTLDTIGFRVG